MKSRHFVGLVFVCLLLALVGGSALAQDKSWTSIASAGTVDESSASIVRFTGNHAEVSAATGAVTIRYNIVPVDGVFDQGYPALKVRFRDDGAGAQVIVRLKRINLETGVGGTLLTFDSNNGFGNGEPGWRTVNKTDCSGGVFDFRTYAYYIEAEIIKGNGGAPGLGIIQLLTGWVC